MNEAGEKTMYEIEKINNLGIENKETKEVKKMVIKFIQSYVLANVIFPQINEDDNIKGKISEDTIYDFVVNREGHGFPLPDQLQDIRNEIKTTLPEGKEIDNIGVKIVYLLNKLKNAHEKTKKRANYEFEKKEHTIEKEIDKYRLDDTDVSRMETWMIKDWVKRAVKIMAIEFFSQKGRILSRNYFKSISDYAVDIMFKDTTDNAEKTRAEIIKKELEEYWSEEKYREFFMKLSNVDWYEYGKSSLRKTKELDGDIGVSKMEPWMIKDWAKRATKIIAIDTWVQKGMILSRENCKELSNKAVDIMFKDTTKNAEKTMAEIIKKELEEYWSEETYQQFLKKLCNLNRNEYGKNSTRKSSAVEKREETKRENNSAQEKYTSEDEIERALDEVREYEEYKNTVRIGLAMSVNEETWRAASEKMLRRRMNQKNKIQNEDDEMTPLDIILDLEEKNRSEEEERRIRKIKEENKIFLEIILELDENTNDENYLQKLGDLNIIKYKEVSDGIRSELESRLERINNDNRLTIGEIDERRGTDGIVILPEKRKFSGPGR